MPQCVLEEHQVHRRVRLVVLLERGRHQPPQVGKAEDPVVGRRLEPICEMAEEEGRLEELCCRDVSKMPAGVLLDERLVPASVGVGGQLVRIDPLRLVQPQLHKLERVGELLRTREQHPLEDAGQVAQREVVVEEGGGLAENGCDRLVERQGSPHQLLAQVLDGHREGPQVASQDGGVDGGERLVRREQDCKCGEEPLKPRVDRARAGARVHRGEVMSVKQLLRLRLGHIVDVAVAQVLPDERESRRAAKAIERRHVEILDEVDEPLVAGRAVAAGPAGLLLERRFDPPLERDSVRHAREPGARTRVAGLGQSPEQAIGQSTADPERRGGGLTGRDDDGGHGRRRWVKIDCRHSLGPRHEILLAPLDVEVKHFAARWEADRLPCVDPPVREIAAVVDAALDRQRRAARPYHGEHKVELEKGGVLGADVLGDQQLLEQHAQRLDHGEGRDGHHGAVVGGQLGQCVQQVLVHKLVQLGRARRPHLLGHGGRLGVYARRHPRPHVILPLALLGDVQDAGARDGAGRGVLEPANLEEHAHVRRQRNPLARRQQKHPPVVHDRLHVLEPAVVHIAVKHQPLGVGVVGHG
eukprot:scaffold12691_cov108-Isochrysis_galbana.AAC.9